MQEKITNGNQSTAGAQNTVTAKDGGANMHYLLRASSRGRGWSGLDADLIDTAAADTTLRGATVQRGNAHRCTCNDHLVS